MPFRQLVPRAVDGVDPIALYRADERPAPANRPWVLVNMITSIDGATAVQGRSGGLGGPGDRTVFGAVRSVADVVLVGAATVRAEGYGPPKTRPAPRVAVVSLSLQLDLDGPLFTESSNRPLVVTSAAADADRLAEVRRVADVVQTAGPRVDPAAALGALGADHGAGTVLCEGGPSLNAQLLAADVVDEVCWTVSPLVAGGTSRRLAEGPDVVPPSRFALQRLLLDDDGLLFGRWLRDRSSPRP